MSLNANGPFDERTVLSNTYRYINSFVSAGGVSPTGLTESDGGNDTTIALTAGGTIEITFPARTKPFKMKEGVCTVLGDEPNLTAKVVSYTQATGKLVIKLYTNAAGTIAAANTTGKVYQINCLFTRRERD